MRTNNHTPSLPVADPRSDRFRCGGRESKFLAAIESCFENDIPMKFNLLIIEYPVRLLACLACLAFAATTALASPTVRVTAPTDGAELKADAFFSATADAQADAGRRIVKVQFFVWSHTPGSGHEGIPCLAEAPNGDLLCVFYAGKYELSDDTASGTSSMRARASAPRATAALRGAPSSGCPRRCPSAQNFHSPGKSRHHVATHCRQNPRLRSLRQTTCLRHHEQTNRTPADSDSGRARCCGHTSR